MGQRHQFYVKLPYEVHQEKERWEQNLETGRWEMIKKDFIQHPVIALHHQWHYGTLPLKSLKRLLDFYETSMASDYEYSMFKKSYGDADDIKMILSVDAERGEITNFSVESFDVALNPMLGDNNDGITIVDLSQEKPKYAFMFLNDKEKVLSAEEYVRYYYNGKEYTRFIGMGLSGWDIDYAKQWELMVLETISYYEDKDMLTIDEVKAMFPAMYEESNEG